MPMKFKILVFSLLLVGCSGQRIEAFEGTAPTLDFFQFFEGKTKATGAVFDSDGALLRQFEADFSGTRDGSSLVLGEVITYHDGEIEEREWRFNRVSSTWFSGKADGVVGTAEGRQAGNAVNLSYTFNVKTESGSWEIHFDDWMYLQPNGTLINRAGMSKFGLDVGEVVIFYTKP